jgi:autotransporter-associated beta strand protein
MQSNHTQPQNRKGSPLIQWMRAHLKTPVTALMLAAMSVWSVNTTVAADADWGVSQSGAPGTYTWQHLYNWNAVGLHENPASIPNAIGAVANLNLVNLTGNQTINLDGAVTLGTLNIGDTVGTQSFILAGGTGGSLTLNNGGTAAINKTGAGWDAIVSSIALANPTDINVANSGALFLGGVMSGTGTINKTGNGLLIIGGNAANTNTGAITIGAGTLLATKATALGTTAGGTTIANGAALALQAGTTSLTIGEALNVQGTGINGTGAIRGLGSNGGSGNELTGVITFAAPTTIRSEAGDLRLNGASNVNNALTLSGAGQIVLQATTGTAPITRYGNANTFFNSGAMAYSGAYTATLGTTLAANANGTMANVSAINMNSGLFQIVLANNATITDAANSRVNNAAPISLNASRMFLEITGANGNFNTAETVGDVTVTGGTALDVEAPNATFTNALTINNLIRNTGSTVNFQGTTLGAAATGGKLLQTIAPTLDAGGTVGGWATFGTEFVKYGANGYTALVAGDYITTAEGTWGATNNVSITGGNQTLTANRTINSLKMTEGASRTVNLGGFTLTVNNGGILTGGGNFTQTISNGFLQPGTASGELFLQNNGVNHLISAVIQDNGGTPTRLIKSHGSTTTLTGANTFTGGVQINGGILRDLPYDGINPIGTNNIQIAGDINNNAVWEFAGDFTRALGTGVNQIQITGGVGSGFGIVGGSSKINFGGAGATITWGSADFNPGRFLLAGGNGYGATKLINPIDLNGEQRYFRVDGSGSATLPGAIGELEGDLTNGGLALGGAGVLVIDTPKSYLAGTHLQSGILWLKDTGTAGGNQLSNDIFVSNSAALRIDSPANIGSNQRIFINNNDANTPAGIAFGPGYGNLDSVTFASATTTNGVFNGQVGSGGQNFLINAPNANRISLQLDGTNTSVDLIGRVNAVNATAQTWFGATGRNGVFTGTTLSPSVGAYRLGAGGGTLTVQNANVVTGAFPLIVGAIDTTARANIGGVVYFPEAQNFSGAVTVGNGGTLIVDSNAGLGTGSAVITMAAGELRVNPADGLWGGTDTQYSARNLNLTGNSTVRAFSTSGGTNQRVIMGTLTLNGADRVFTNNNIGGTFNDLVFGNVSLTHTANANQFFDIGADNAGGTTIVTLNGVVDDPGVGNIQLVKRNAGTLILNADNTYASTTQVQQGRLVLNHVGAAGQAASGIIMNTTSDRRSDLEFRSNGAGPFTFNNTVAVQGGNDASTRVLNVGPSALGSTNQTVQVNSLSVNAGGTWTLNNTTGSTSYFDGSHGYRLQVTGATTLAKDWTFRPRGAVLQLDGVVSGLFGLEKGDQGTLILNGANTYGAATGFAVSTGLTTLLANPRTIVSNGYVVAGNDAAFSTGPVVLRNNAFTQVLASGVRTIANGFENLGSGSTQTLGGLDAGAKTFSGQVILNTAGLNLTAATGGDVSFTGVISQNASALGITKVGNGTVILNPATGTGNTFAGPVTVSGGILEGRSQVTSGSPFGVNTATTITNGTLRLANNTGATNSTVTTGVLTINNSNAGIQIDSTGAGGGNTTFGFGSLVRSNNATMTVKGLSADIGAATTEVLSFTAAPGVANNTIGTWAVLQGNASNAGHYAGVTGSNIVTATYSGTGDLDTSAGATTLFDATGVGGTLTANRSVYAFRTDTAVALGTFNLNVGNPDSATLGQAGMILNNGADITTGGGVLNFGTNALNVYVDDAATSTISATLTNSRVQNSNTIPSGLVKFGPGTLEIATPTTFEGNVQVNQGTLSLTTANAFKVLENLNVATGAIVTIQPGATVQLNNNNQEFGNLAGSVTQSAVNASGGRLDLGTATLTVGREGTAQTFSGQIVGGAGSTIIKVGAGALTLNNYDTAIPNSLANLYIDQGTVASRANDNSWATPTGFASSIPSNTDVYLRGGTWQVRAIGDSTGNAQSIYLGNNVIAGGGDSTLNTVRDQGGGANKLLIFNNLTLGVNRLTTSNDNTFIPRFDGTTTLTNFGRVTTDNQLVLAGNITGNYSLEKRGGSDLTIAANNSAWSGGLVITDGTVLFGNRGTDEIRYAGTNFVPMSTSNAGTGDIVLNRASAIRLNAPSNVLTGSGQRVQMFGHSAAVTTRVDVGTDAALTAYGLRALDHAAVSLNSNESLWSTAIDMSKIGGSGKGSLSALSAVYYTAPTLGAGVGNTYRFAGANNALFSIVNTGVVTGSASVEVGRTPVLSGGVASGTIAQLKLFETQNYTGATTIFRGADSSTVGNVLEVNGPSTSTSVYDVFGRLTLRGSGRNTTDAGAVATPLNLYPGSILRLDYQMEVNDTFAIARQTSSNLGMDIQDNKLADSAALLLNGSTLELTNRDGRVNSEVIGALTVQGGAGVRLERTGTNGQIVLIADSLARSGQGTFTIRENANELGSTALQSMKMFVNTAPAVTNGIVEPWMVNGTRSTFLGYGATGFTNAAFVVGTPSTTAGTLDTFLGTLTSTSVASINPGWGDQTITGTRNVYALRVQQEANNNSIDIGGTATINIHSGGLITTSQGTGRVNFGTTNLYFGDGTTAREAIIHLQNADNVNTVIGGTLTATNLTLVGPGGLQLTGTNAISGTIEMQGGGNLFLDGLATIGSNKTINLTANNAGNNAGGQMPVLNLRHNSSATTYTGLVINVTQDLPVATITSGRYTGAGTTTQVQFQSLNIAGTNTLQGTYLNLNNSNANVTVLGANTWGGSAPIGLSVGSNTWQFAGNITSSAPIYKWGGGVLRLDNVNRDAAFSSPITLNAGELRIQAQNAAGSSTQAEGTGALTLNGGTLRLAAQNITTTNSTTTFYSSPNQHITVGGNTTFVYDRNGGTPAAGSNNITIGAAGLEFRTVNSPTVSFDAATFGDGLRIASEIVIRDQPLFRHVDHNVFFNNVIRGNGTMTHVEGWYANFNNNAANPNWTGGFDNFQGYARVTPTATSFTFGTGPVRNGPTAAISLNSTTNIAGGAVAQFSSGQTTPTVLAVNTTGALAALSTLFPSANNTSRSGMGGILGLDALSTNAAIDLSTFQDGYWFLGAFNNASTYTGNAGAITAGAGDIYRIGGNTGALTFTPATPGSNIFTGATSQLLIGKPDAWHSAGFNGTLVTLNVAANADHAGGTTISRGRDGFGTWYQGGVNVEGGATTATTFRTPLGTGNVDVFGHLRLSTASGSMLTAAGNNYANIVLHPGSRLTFDNRTASVDPGGEGRYDDQGALTLNGAALHVRSTTAVNATAAVNREDIGDLTISRGSHIRLSREAAGSFVGLGINSLIRGTNGTLTINHTAALLGAGTAAGAANSENVFVTGGSPILNTNGMVDPWILSRQADQFLRYDSTNGLRLVSDAGAPAEYINVASGVTSIDGTVLTINDGTRILDLGAAAATQTLAMNPDVYALRVARNLNVSADNAFGQVTVRSGGLIFLANSPIINANIDFGLNGGAEALVYAGQSTGQINGQIRATQVTKFGRAFINVNSDQPQFTGNWVINEGGIQFLTPGSLGAVTSQVILNGSPISDDDDRRDGGASFIPSELRYNYNSGSPDNFTWNHGKITAYDHNLIRAATASDRMQTIPAIDLRTTNTTPGSGLHPGLIRIQVDGSRSILNTGTVTLFDHYTLSAESGTFGPGATTAVRLGALNNAGAFDLTKIGDGMLALGDNSATFTGNRFFVADEGGVRALHNGAFGAAGNTAVFNQGTALEIAVAGFSPLATMDQRPGSYERWAVDGARSGAYTLPQGVSLQVFANQTGMQTINLNGGSIMGYQPLDYDNVATINSLGAGVTINLTGNSFLGQNAPAGAQTANYDLGRENTVTGGNPNDPALRGSYLQIYGNITGTGNLTKVGKDVILLRGANTYVGVTTVRNGVLQIGQNNSLPVATSLVMDGSAGTFDLNGYNQEVASLSGAAGSVSNGAFDDNTLTVNQATNTTYGGTVDGNVTVQKKGAGVLTFTPVGPLGETNTGNGYRGGTVIEAGKIAIAQDNALGWQRNSVDADNIRFTGGTLQTTASVTLHANRGVQLDAAGGTIEVNPTFTSQVNGKITGIGSFSKTGDGILQINNVDNNYTGATNVIAGTLRGGAVDALAPLSRHIVTGDTVSGTLALNGIDQSIGSLSSTGATQANATVALSSTLTVGLDGTKDAVYSGTITGITSSIFRVNGNGAVQTLSTVNNSAQVWNTQIANGVLNVANGAQLSAGTTSVQIGVASVSGADDFTGLHLQNTATFANNIAVNNVNNVGSAAITSSVVDATISGTVTLDRNIYAGAAPSTQLSLTNTVSGNGTITVVDGGTLRLTSANTYGAGVGGTSGTPFAGGTVVRAGTVLLENDTAAGTNVISIGDQTSSIGAAVDRATFSSIIGSGTFNPNGDGVTAVSGGQNAAGTTGFGAFIGVNSTVDGNTYTGANLGARLLIAGEEANPERNGIYTIVSVSGATMNLVRADDFETSNQMRYGGQVAVTNGTYAGQTMFQFEEQAVVRNETTLEPLRFRQDIVNPNLAVLQNVSGLTVANNIVVNATNGSGTVTIGGSSAVTTGTGTFSGTVQLQDRQVGVSETKLVTLTSSTPTGNGITFSGQINAADQVSGSPDVLSIIKAGTGTVTLTHTNNNYTGPTTVTDGRLQVGDGGLAGTGSLTGTGAVSVTGAGTSLATAPVLAGGSGTTAIAGATTVGTLTNPGILAPGIANSATSNQSMTFGSAGGITVVNGSQLQMSITTPTLNAGNATVTAWLGSGNDLNTYLTANPAAVPLVNIAPGTYGDLDYINISAAGLSLGTRASGTFGDGALLVQDNGYTAGTPAAGDLFNLLDWVTAMAGTFAVPGVNTPGGVYGDLDLPTLTGGLVWDVSALTSHGIVAVVVVPEPSRMVLLLIGLLGLGLRRRRRSI